MPAPVTRFEFAAHPSMDRVAFALVQWADVVDDWRPAFRDIEKLFYRHERELFATSGRGKSSQRWPKWEKLSKRYGAYKKRVRPGRPILTFDGALRRAASGGSGSIRRVRRDSLLLGIQPGTDLAVIARAHATGVRGPSGGWRLPPRPPIRFDGDVTKRGTSFGWAVMQIMQSHMVLARKAAMRSDPEVLKRISFGDTPSKAKSQIGSILRKSYR